MGIFVKFYLFKFAALSKLKSMKKILFFLLALIIIACSNSDDSTCGTYNGKSVYEGPQGGCYYINSSGNKEYVDRSYCNC
ncbi:hypothetical protein DEU42_113128 [Flavobacterium sp. AG291]|nr:hypothetical protein DEU42_113128 [Flavobacterium sp. AG291]